MSKQIITNSIFKIIKFIIAKMIITPAIKTIIIHKIIIKNKNIIRMEGAKITIIQRKQIFLINIYYQNNSLYLH
jgi:hypothetical protein